MKAALMFLCVLFKDMTPEFIKMLDEPLVVLELPSSIVVSSWKKTNTYLQ